MIGYITWIVFINIALWRIRGDDDDFGMDEGDECDYMYNEYQNEKVHHWENIDNDVNFNEMRMMSMLVVMMMMMMMMVM